MGQQTSCCNGRELLRANGSALIAGVISGEACMKVIGAATGTDGYDIRPQLDNDQWRTLLRNCQYLWIGLFQATSVPVDSVGAESADGVMSVGRSSSLPLWKTAPARTRATRCGALTARQRAWAASISL